MKTLEDALSEISLALNMDVESRDDCAALVRTVTAALPPPTSENALRRVLASCIFFSLRSPDRKNTNSPFITVSHILAAASLDLVTFAAALKEMKTLLESLPATAHIAAAVGPALSALSVKYCITSGFWVRYNQLFTTLFGSDPDASRRGSMLPYLHELGWMAFLVARNAAFPTSDAAPLVSLHAIIVAVLARLAEHARPKLGLDAAAVSLEAICAKDSADLLEAQRLDGLHVAPLFSAPDLHALHRAYAACYLEQGDFDEKLYLSNDPQLVPATSASTPVTVFGGTPIRAAIKTLDKLRETLGTRSTTPSPELVAMFAACRGDAAAACHSAIEALRQPFLTEHARRLGPDSSADRRFDDAIRLFYRYLETIATAERARLQRQDLSVILANPAFTRALFCCALDIILFVYASAQVGRDAHLDWLLALVGVPAFDFLKLLETVVRSENCLTESLATHARVMEDRIVLQLAWAEGSPLWDCLRKVPLQSAPPSQRGFLSPARGPAGSPYVSPSPASDAALYAAEATPAQSDQATVRAVSFFSRKLMRVVQSNLRRLAQGLKLPPDVVVLTFSAVQHALAEHPTLVKNLHVDHVIMGSIYSVCKLLDHACPFKSIVYEYRRIDWPCPAPCRAIALPSGPGDVIAYYNEVFLPAMKSFIFDLVQERRLGEGPPPRPGRAFGARQATVIMTPHTALLHCSLESPFRIAGAASALTSSPMQRKRLFDATGPDSEASPAGGIRHRLSLLRRTTSTPGPSTSHLAVPAAGPVSSSLPHSETSMHASNAATPVLVTDADVPPASPLSLDAAHALVMVAGEDPASSQGSIVHSTQETV